MYIYRQIADPLKSLVKTPVGKCLILTGARQTGKTTLLQREFTPGYEYHSFDEVLTRQDLARRPAAEWLARDRSYIFDEVHKSPGFLGTVKVILDRGKESNRVILSGSAQIQLLSAVRESLAGRSVTRELFPLTVAEMAGVSRPVACDLFSSESTRQVGELIRESSFSERMVESAAAARVKLDHVIAWGGMPALLELEEDEHRWIWLEEYCRTYLQRDVSDLGRVSDLDNFVRLERAASHRTAGILNYADLARDADLSPLTAKKYMRYLDLSYQTFLLDAFRKPGATRFIKAPKLHWVDIGVQRALSGLRSGLTGPQFESVVVGELVKLAKSLRLDVEMSYLRTKDGREVDLLVRLPTGAYLAWEVKSSARAAPADARHLRGLEPLLDGPLLAGFILYRGREVHAWDKNLFALPAPVLFAENV